MKIQELCQGVENKVALLANICAKYGLSSDEVAYVGDDLVDFDIMKAVGVSACPADSVPEIIEIADYVCQTNGGKGVVRELIEQILKARGEWNNFGF